MSEKYDGYTKNLQALLNNFNIHANLNGWKKIMEVQTTEGMKHLVKQYGQYKVDDVLTSALAWNDPHHDRNCQNAT